MYEKSTEYNVVSIVDEFNDPPVIYFSLVHT